MKLLTSKLTQPHAEKAAGKPKELRSTFHTSDEDATIVLDDRKKTVTVNHDL